MKKAYIATAVFLAVVGISKLAFGVGPVTISSVQPVQPGTACAYFEVTGGAANAWYAIVVSDASFTSQFGIIMSSFYSGTPVTFATAGTACGYSKLQWIYIGTAK